MYLKYHWTNSGAKGLRGWLRWLDHKLHAWMETFTYPRARQVVVPSLGLAGELRAEFPFIENKLTVLPNPVSLESLQMPGDFDRRAFRHGLGIDDQDLVGCSWPWDSLSARDCRFCCRRCGRDRRVKLIVVGVKRI